MKTSVTSLVVSASLFALAGCSSSDPTNVTDDGGGSDSAADVMAMDTRAEGDVGSEVGGKLDGGTDSGTGAGKDAASTPDDGVMSADCKTYCDCFEANCASIQAIPGGLGCGAFCATFTKDQWSCRNNHCQLVVPEKNPGHCMHAVGIDQCM